MSNLEDYVDSALARYFKILNTKPKDGEEDDLKKFYNEHSKLTIGDRRLGSEKIVEILRKEQREFSLDNYSCLSLDSDHVIITGQCILGNSKITFSIALETLVDGNGDSNIYISNQIMNI